MILSSGVCRESRRLITVQAEKEQLLRIPARDYDLVDLAEPQSSDEGSDTEHELTPEGEDHHSITLLPGQVLKGTGFMVREPIRWAHAMFSPAANYKNPAWLQGILQSSDGSTTPLPSLTLNEQDLRRWRMAWRAILLCEQHDYQFEAKRPLIQRYSDWPGLRYMLDMPVGFTFSTVALAYGGLHALAWNAHFGSSVQQLLWRISACIVMGGFPVGFTLAALEERWRETLNQNTINTPLKSKRETQMKNAQVACLRILELFVVIITAFLLLAYAFARGYLVVECFLNLAHLPEGVYDVPQWTAYFPHIA